MAEGDGAMLMVGISVPLFRARLAAGVNEARAMARMAEADLTSMQVMIEGDAVAAREGVIASLAELEVLQREVVPRATMATQSALAAYASGRGTLVTVVEAARALWDTRSELVMAETAVAVAWSRLERAVGAPGGRGTP